MAWDLVRNAQKNPQIAATKEKQTRVSLFIQSTVDNQDLMTELPERRTSTQN